MPNGVYGGPVLDDTHRIFGHRRDAGPCDVLDCDLFDPVHRPAAVRAMP